MKKIYDFITTIRKENEKKEQLSNEQNQNEEYIGRRM